MNRPSGEAQRGVGSSMLCKEQQLCLINLNKLELAFYGSLATFTNNGTLIKDALQGNSAGSSCFIKP